MTTITNTIPERLALFASGAVIAGAAGAWSAGPG